MESAEQAAGERRVKELLVDPLHRRGLMKPSGQTRAQFVEMQDDICRRLAYMSAGALMALEEACAAQPGGKDRDRFPLGPHVLKWAADIEPPQDSASPLIRAVFRHRIGLDAIDGGYAPELLVMLRRDRRWPTAYALKLVRDQADGPMRELERIETALARGEDVPERSVSFRQRRLAMIRKCREIADAAALSDAAQC